MMMDMVEDEEISVMMEQLKIQYKREVSTEEVKDFFKEEFRKMALLVEEKFIEGLEKLRDKSVEEVVEYMVGNMDEETPKPSKKYYEKKLGRELTKDEVMEEIKRNCRKRILFYRQQNINNTEITSIDYNDSINNKIRITNTTPNKKIRDTKHITFIRTNNNSHNNILPTSSSRAQVISHNSDNNILPPTSPQNNRDKKQPNPSTNTNVSK